MQYNYGWPKEEAKAIEEFDPSLVPSIGKTFTGEVVGLFTFNTVTDDDKLYAVSGHTTVKSTTIIFEGDYVTIEGIISASATVESHDYIVISSEKTLSYEGVGTLRIGSDLHRPVRNERKITFDQLTTKPTKITCDTEEDAISLWNGLMDIWLKERSK